MAQTFTLFGRLPLELRLMIWRFALPDDEPEVFILRGVHMPSGNEEEPPEAMTVDTAFPALMHTCRESRDFVLRRGGLRFRPCPEAGCDSPFRDFRPELDTVFWNEDLYDPLWSYVDNTDAHARWLSQLRHLAIPSSTSLIGQHTTECVIEHCPELQTFSVVFPDSETGGKPQLSFAEPQRRCKLRRICPERARLMTVEPNTWEWAPDRRVTVKEFLVLFRNRLNEHGEEANSPHEECPGQAWTTELDAPGKLLCFAQTFVEWRNGEWVEACAGR
jgi:hypothetical protein